MSNGRSDAPAGRQFGLITLICVVIASMVGSGVFTSSGFAIAALGSPGRVMLAWMVGGGVAICGAVSYGELARRLPLSGGEYLYLSRQLHPFAGFLAGWVSLTAGFSGAIAMAAMTFEAYAIPDADRPAWMPARLLALSAILLFGSGHAFLVRLFAAIQNTVVLIKISALILFLIIAAGKFYSHEWSTAPLSAELIPLGSFAFLPLLAGSVMWISLSYAGFNAAVYIAAEVPDAERRVPRALIAGTLIVTVLYLLLNAVFVTAAPGSEIAGRPDVAAVAATAIGGHSLNVLMRFAICLGTLSSVAGMIMTGPRVFSRMADDGVFPALFASGPKSVARTVLLQTILAAVLVIFSDLHQMLKYLSTTLAISSAVTVLTLFLPQRRRPDNGPEQHRDMSLIVRLCSALYVTCTFITAALMMKHEPRDLRATVVTVLIGSILWLVLPVRRTH